MRRGRAGPTNVRESTDEGFAEKHICNGDGTAEPCTQPASWGRSSEIVFRLELAHVLGKTRGKHPSNSAVRARPFNPIDRNKCMQRFQVLACADITQLPVQEESEHQTQMEQHVETRGTKASLLTWARDLAQPVSQGQLGAGGSPHRREHELQEAAVPPADLQRL